MMFYYILIPQLMQNIDYLQYKTYHNLTPVQKGVGFEIGIRTGVPVPNVEQSSLIYFL